MSAWLRRWLLGVLCLLGLASVVRAQCVDLSAPGSHFALREGLELLRDEHAELTPEAALRHPGWQGADAPGLKPGLTRAAIWLRLRACNPSSVTTTRWLVIDSPRIERVDFLRFAAGEGRLLDSAQGGLGRALDLRPLRSAQSIFPLTLAAGESADLLLRVEGRTRMVLDLEVWEPLAFREQESARMLTHLLWTLAVLVAALLVLMHSLARSDRPLRLLSVWLFTMALYESTFLGYLYRFVLDAGGEMPVRATLIFGSLASLVSMMFACEFLELRRWRAYRIFYRIQVGLICLLIALAALGDLRLANQVSGLVLLPTYLNTPLALLQSRGRLLSRPGLYFIASLGVWTAALLRTGLFYADQLRAVLPHENVLIMFASVVLALGLILGLLRQSVLTHRAYQNAQTALLKAGEGRQARLEAVVWSRTRALQEALLSAHEASRAKGDLLSRVNQDLRAPLHDIIAQADLALAGTAQEAECAAIIRRSATHLLSLIDDLVDCSPDAAEPHALRAERVDFPAFIDSIIADASALAQLRGNRFICQRADALPAWVEFDPKRLRQVLINLLDNAAKFTRAGRIELRLDWCRIGDEAEVALAEFRFSVIDTGPGIAAADLPVIFEPFQRLNEAQSPDGLGLGLAIARQWVERMGGQIEADSEPGRGTELQVRLPLAFSTALVAASPADLPPASPMPEPEPDLAGGWPADSARPAPELLAQAAELVRLGALSDLIDWAQALAADPSHDRRFLSWLLEAAESGDLRGLAARLESQS